MRWVPTHEVVWLHEPPKDGGEQPRIWVRVQALDTVLVDCVGRRYDRHMTGALIGGGAYPRLDISTLRRYRVFL